MKWQRWQQQQTEDAWNNHKLWVENSKHHKKQKQKTLNIKNKLWCLSYV